jgi:large-conductance mechanosensitive channel
VVKAFNSARKRFETEKAAPPPPAGPTKEETLLTEIRDLLAEAGLKIRSIPVVS